MFTLDDVTPFSLEDMQYRCDDFGNQTYEIELDNGDILRLRKCWREGYPWEWSVSLPEELSGYAMNYRSHVFDEPQGALADFFECYGGRSWLSRAEQYAIKGPSYCRCTGCGWQGEMSELLYETVYEDFGDVVYAECPSCHRVEYDGMELFEEI